MLIPIFWRTLAIHYLRTFFLSVGSFLAVLFVLRFKEIARFTALSGDWKTTALFTLYQFPLILPIAIPISAFLASFLLMQKMSQTSELTAARSCGFGFGSLLAPLLIPSLFLALLNFMISAEIAPYCRRASKLMLSKETTENPILLLQRQQLVKLKHAYLSMDADEKKAKNLLLIVHNNKSEHLNLLWAPSLLLKGDQLIAKNLALVSYLPENTLLLEQQESLITKAHFLSTLLKKTHIRCEMAALPLCALFTHKKKSAWIECLRRCSIALSVFTFTLLGSSFGIEIRRVSKQAIIPPLCLLAFALIAYLVAKEIKSFALFFLSTPHILICLCAIRRLFRLNRGIL